MKHCTIVKTWKKVNREHFGGLLEQPYIRFSRSSVNLASYDGITMRFDARTIKGLSELFCVVYHECVHQFIFDILEIEPIDEHGKTYQQYYNYFANGNSLLLAYEGFKID